MTTGNFSFGKEEHLKGRKKIENLFVKGNSFFVHPIKVFWKIIPQTLYDFENIAGTPAYKNSAQVNVHPVLVGVSVSKRNFKKAVNRNRIKRLLREAYRLNKHYLLLNDDFKDKELDICFIFIDKTLPSFELVQEKMMLCLKKLQKNIKIALV